MSLVVKWGKAFIDGKFIKKDILIVNGVIEEIGNDLKGDEIVDAKNLLVLPGLIDPHVHLREPGATEKEDFLTGGRAAIAGGFTTVIDMPNNPNHHTVTKERLEEKQELAKKAPCDVLFHFGANDTNFEEVTEADPPSLKIYLGLSTGGMKLENPDSLKRHFLNFPNDRPVVLHACDSSPDPEKNLKKTHEITEHAVTVASEVGQRIHLAHASTKKEVMIAKRYEKCTVEVAPHHLFLSQKNWENLGLMKRVYPQLRREQDRIMLMSAFEKFDCIASDHAPHTIEEKQDGAAGFPGLETSLALMFDACHRGLMDKIKVTQMMSENAARIFNIENKGKIKKGYVGDITIVDPKKEWKIAGNRMETKCRWTPFEGRKVKGKAHTVIKDGKLVFTDYMFI